MKNITDNLKEYYAQKFKEHGANSYGVDWGDQEKADTRYKAMLNVLKGSGTLFSILDVGCGYGGFLKYIEDQQITNVNFHGIDVVEKMIQHATEKFPHSHFMVGDIMDDVYTQTFDYVTCNGILTQKLSASDEDMTKFMKDLIIKMFDLCNIGIAFNTMSTLVDFQAKENFYNDPSEMFKLASSISNHVKIDHSYPLYEYTVYIYK